MKFSEAFKMECQQVSLDFIDIPLDTDLQFFIDPTSIRALKTKSLSQKELSYCIIF